MKISPEAKEALAGSIEKWRTIVHDMRVGLQPDENGSDDCPLCQKFNPHVRVSRSAAPGLEMHKVIWSKGCEGCPIQADTKRMYCAGTPYDKWSEDDDDGITVGQGNTLENAEMMLDYLTKLNARCEVETPGAEPVADPIQA